MTQATTRQEGYALGEMYYYTGKPCKHGHLSNRLTSNCICTQCSREIYQPADRDRYRNGNTLVRQFGTRINSARKAGIPCSITFEEIDQPTHCPILGIKLNYEWSGSHCRDPAKATFDKIIPELGYVSGNVKIISWKANRMKNDMTLHELKLIMEYIQENFNND